MSTRPIGWTAKDAGKTRVVIVGGGISGLSAAHRLHELARERNVPLAVRLLEGSSRLGGQIRTEHTGELLLEGGPDSLVTYKPAAVALCKRLGLENALVRPVAARAGMSVARRGELFDLPDGLMMMAPARVGPLLRSPLLSWSGKARVLLERFVPARRPAGEDESLRSFATRRFGNELFERVAEPVLAGLFMADADRMSLSMRMPRFLALEQEHGSLTRAIVKAARRSGSSPPVVSLRDGMGSIVEKLVAALPPGWPVTDAAVERIERNEASGCWRVHVGTSALEADTLVLACPSHASAELLRPLDAELARDLARLQYASCATVNLVYRRSDFRRVPPGFGFFVPRTEKTPLIACNYASLKFEGRAPDDRIVLRAFLGGALHPGVLDLDDDEMVREAREAFRELLSLEDAPSLIHVHRSPLSMPQFQVGDTERVERIVERAGRSSGLLLCGDALGAFGLPDCISSGEQAARQTLERAQGGQRSLELAL